MPISSPHATEFVLLHGTRSKESSLSWPVVVFERYKKGDIYFQKEIYSDWLIDFNGMLTHQELSYVLKLGNKVHFTFFCSCILTNFLEDDPIEYENFWQIYL